MMIKCINPCEVLQLASGPWQAFNKCRLLSGMERELFQAEQEFVQGAESLVWLEKENAEGLWGERLEQRWGTSDASQGCS